jgi:hypothetical protein
MARWSSYQSPGSRNPFRIQEKSLVVILRLFFEEISIGKECHPTVFAFVGNLHTSQHYLYQHLMIMIENDQKAHTSQPPSLLLYLLLLPTVSSAFKLAKRESSVFSTLVTAKSVSVDSVLECLVQKLTVVTKVFLYFDMLRSMWRAQFLTQKCMFHILSCIQ